MPLRPGADVDTVQTQSIAETPVTPPQPLTSIHPLGFLTLYWGASIQEEGHDLARVFHMCRLGQALSFPGATDPFGNLRTLKNPFSEWLQMPKIKLKRKPARLLMTIISQRELDFTATCVLGKPTV